MNIQPTSDQVDSIFERYTAPGSPGCALAVMRDGDIVYKQGYGLADLEHNVPILPSTVFNIGSMAKQFTAFGIALLEAEGRLSFDDDIRQYLPEMHHFGETVAIRHLIHHCGKVKRRLLSVQSASSDGNRRRQDLAEGHAAACKAVRCSGLGRGGVRSREIAARTAAGRSWRR
jgi:CubicO group peptidase (beta-lactamase class C family)